RGVERRAEDRLMRAGLAFLALLLAAAPARDWRETTARTPADTFVTGNPAAKVRLVEYASYTCPHCAAFSAESQAVLKDHMVRDGSVSVEFRHLIRDGLDLGAAILARCTGPRGFAPTTAYIFATQDDWLSRGIQFQQANARRLSLYPRLGQVRALVDGAGLTAMIEARGLAPARVDACFADEAEADRILAITAGAPREVDVTPSFFVQGRIVPRVGWAGLEPVLRAAGAR
ncbi:DsbA family protein, partial [Sphingomonas bacterium]|uniref:DsbA family protein n=1 Tax=Sphingomonas bacterium TaxID=1895847 RepID=UPI001C2D8765